MDKKEQTHKLARELISLARDTITVRFRFLDTALGRLSIELRDGLFGMACSGDKIYVDPAYLLITYLDEPGIAVRGLMHMMLHNIFFHGYQYDKLDSEYWDIAADIAVENIILEMEFVAAACSRDEEEAGCIQKLRKRVPELTAEKLYREFRVNEPSSDTLSEYRRLFVVDLHEGWRQNGAEKELVISEKEWKKITERIKTELKAFSKNQNNSESFEKNLLESTRQRYDYRQILQKFTVSGEEIEVNPDEFDYVYYMYGLDKYGNMPLIEPLEYCETKRIKDFVIAIDTSASCRGELVKSFIKKTYDILKESESFFKRVNIHIIQCDARVQSDVVIHDEHELLEYISNMEIRGFGATDFRPVFDYVEELRQRGEFEGLKGLIYFTDGYGVYPEKMPEYDVIFAFLNEDMNRQPVPGWAMKVVMEDELYEY